MRLPTRGFTIIELLVVIAILAVLTGFLLIVINPSQIRAKARDAQRMNNLRAIQTALELYKTSSSTRTYPLSVNWIVLTGTDAVSRSLKDGGYINVVSVDPITSSTTVSPCSYLSGGSPFLRFNYRSDGNYYLLTAQMEVVSSAVDHLCADLSQWSKAQCTAKNLNCAGFEDKGQ